MNEIAILTLNCWWRPQVYNRLQASPAALRHNILHPQEPDPTMPALPKFRLYRPSNPIERARAATYVRDNIPPSAVFQVHLSTADLIILDIKLANNHTTRFINVYNDCTTREALHLLSAKWPSLPPLEGKNTCLRVFQSPSPFLGGRSG